MEKVFNQFEALKVAPPPSEEEDTRQRAFTRWDKIRNELSRLDTSSDLSLDNMYQIVTKLRTDEQQVKWIIRQYDDREERFLERQRSMVPIELMKSFNNTVNEEIARILRELQSNPDRYLDHNQKILNNLTQNLEQTESKLQIVTDEIRNITRKIEQQNLANLHLPGYQTCVADLTRKFGLQEVTLEAQETLKDMEKLLNEDLTSKHWNLERERCKLASEVQEYKRKLKGVNQKRALLSEEISLKYIFDVDIKLISKRLASFKNLGEEIARFFDKVECRTIYDPYDEKIPYLHLAHMYTKRLNESCSICDDIGSWGVCHKNHKFKSVTHRNIPM